MHRIFYTTIVLTAIQASGMSSYSQGLQRVSEFIIGNTRLFVPDEFLPSVERPCSKSPTSSLGFSSLLLWPNLENQMTPQARACLRDTSECPGAIRLFVRTATVPLSQQHENGKASFLREPTEEMYYGLVFHENHLLRTGALDQIYFASASAGDHFVFGRCALQSGTNRMRSLAHLTMREQVQLGGGRCEMRFDLLHDVAVELQFRSDLLANWSVLYNKTKALLLTFVR